jgi:heptaprenyl diphosphate synthase
LAAVALLFGSAMTLIYSLAGAVLSLALMSLLKKSNLFSMIGVSIVGGVSHNLGQILVAMWLMETAEIGYYMIILTVTGTIAGILIGLAGSFVLKYLNNLNI